MSDTKKPPSFLELYPCHMMGEIYCLNCNERPCINEEKREFARKFFEAGYNFSRVNVFVERRKNPDRRKN